MPEGARLFLLWVLPSPRFPNGFQVVAGGSRHVRKHGDAQGRRGHRKGTLKEEALSGWDGAGTGGPRRAVTPLRLEQHRMWNHWPGSAVPHAVRCFPGDIICEQRSPDPRWRSRQKDHWNTGMNVTSRQSQDRKARAGNTHARTHTHSLLSLPLALPIPCYPPMRPPPPLPPKLSPPPPTPDHQLVNVFRTKEPRRQAASGTQPC